jgi:hypothetical protein
LNRHVGARHCIPAGQGGERPAIHRTREGQALVERPKIPANGGNATGDTLETGGKMAVLQLE